MVVGQVTSNDVNEKRLLRNDSRSRRETGAGGASVGGAVQTIYVGSCCSADLRMSAVTFCPAAIGMETVLLPPAAELLGCTNANAEVSSEKVAPLIPCAFLNPPNTALLQAAVSPIYARNAACANTRVEIHAGYCRFWKCLLALSLMPLPCEGLGLVARIVTIHPDCLEVAVTALARRREIPTR